jgi:hypothetical protein
MNFCPVAKRPTIDDLARGHFRASDGVWRWYAPIKVYARQEWLPPQMNQAAIAKAICAIALLVAGCSPAPEPHRDLRPWIATSGMYSLMSPSPAPLPPAPTPGAVCENCRGNKVIGDGKTAIVCPVCNGTGVAPAEKPQASPEKPVSAVGGQEASPARFAAPWPPEAVSVGTDGGPTFRIVCEDGVCRKIRVMPATGR